MLNEPGYPVYPLDPVIIPNEFNKPDLVVDLVFSY
jgi:hypothetical protein